ncbi:M20 family metallopeptidase [Streptomyces sp. NBC_01237]|uniref:M20 family metallopeptidase n=1 Tax=Streptomyces sp. NBC_01237 TaxID=2903790 RepID=UPI002DDB4164|nr:M20/M25/M40 family metallo-hydrolase [Streptomyces sp. NBC_01237]WRZ77220.1 M20/M25/M40 family metallo-hydrolase [Streptomyces sp. NBC_01237]
MNGFDFVELAGKRAESVVRLAQDLVRLPSRGGLDDYGPVLDRVELWLRERSLPYRRLYGPDAGCVGLLVEIEGGRPGSWWTLDACLDTAPFGDEEAWSFPPTAGDVVGGWLRGRGAADSKLAASVFCHVAEDVQRVSGRLAGGLSVLLDVDEHTGQFGGARAFLADPDARRPSGVMIGYPGLDDVVVGGRGLWRAVVTVHAPAGHSGSSKNVVSAVSRAARLVQLLDSAELPGADYRFPLPAKLSVTSIAGGSGWSVTPDRVDLNVDVRLTPALDGPAAAALVGDVVAQLDAQLPPPVPTEVVEVACWPPFRLGPDQEPAAAMFRSADVLGAGVKAKTAGPSNIGNLLAGHNVPATAGFGTRYEGLHGTDECARLTDLPLVHALYHRTVLDLLGAFRPA